MSRQPLFIAGHHVQNPGMSSLGVKDQFFAYAAGPDTLAVGQTTDLLSDTNSPWPMSRFQFHSLPNSQDELTVVCLHPIADRLCVGTAQSGLYLTSATNPILSADTQMPIDTTGEHVHCACFLTDRQANWDDEEDGEYLVYSSSFASPQGSQSPHRLSLWSMRHSCVVWRGASEPLHGMCSLFPQLAFAACSEEKMVNVYTVRVKDELEDVEEASAAALEQEEGLAGRFLLVSRTCATSDAWGPRPSFVCCAARPPPPMRLRGGGGPNLRDDDGSFVALTANGFLVEYNKTSGVVMKWMDCKDPCARSLLVSRHLVSIGGEAMRHFDVITWEFNGKHQCESRTSWIATAPSSSSPVVAVSCIVYQSRCICFLSNGGLLVYQQTRGEDVTPTHSGLHFKRLYNYVPMVDVKSEKSLPRLHWIQPSVDGVMAEGTPCGLWCALGIRVVDSGDLHNATQSPLRFNSGAFNAEWNLFLGQCSQTGQLIAFDPQDLWQKKAAVNMPYPLISITVNDEGTVAALGENHVLYYVGCRWIMSGVGCVSSLVLEHRSQRDISKGRFNALRFAGEKLYAVGHTHIMNTSDSSEHHWKEPILRAESIGSHLLLLFPNHCERFDPHSPDDQRRLVTLPFMATSTSTMVVEPTQQRLVAVEQSAEILVFDVHGDGVPLLYLEHRHHIPGVRVKLIGFMGAGKHKWRLLVCDHTGMTCVYEVDTRKKRRQIDEQDSSTAAGAGLPTGSSGTKRKGNSPVPHAQQQTVGPNQKDRGASSSSGNAVVGPSSDQLNDRFSELTDFYKSQNLSATPRSGRQHRHRLGGGSNSQSQSFSSPPVSPQDLEDSLPAMMDPTVQKSANGEREGERECAGEAEQEEVAPRRERRAPPPTLSTPGVSAGVTSTATQRQSPPTKGRPSVGAGKRISVSPSSSSSSPAGTEGRRSAGSPAGGTTGGHARTTVSRQPLAEPAYRKGSDEENGVGVSEVEVSALTVNTGATRELAATRDRVRMMPEDEVEMGLSNDRANNSVENNDNTVFRGVPNSVDEEEEDANPSPQPLLHSPEKPPAALREGRREPLQPNKGGFGSGAPLKQTIHERPAGITTDVEDERGGGGMAPRRKPDTAGKQKRPQSAQQLRESLVQLNSFLTEGCDTDVLDDSFDELRRLYDTITHTLQRTGRSTSTLSTSASADMSSVESQMLRSEMLRIQEQNQRLAAQNEEILNALRRGENRK